MMIGVTGFLLYSTSLLHTVLLPQDGRTHGRHRPA